MPACHRRSGKTLTSGQIGAKSEKKTKGKRDQEKLLAKKKNMKKDSARGDINEHEGGRCSYKHKSVFC